MIDESSCAMIDEMDTHIVDDIRDAKRRGSAAASHLCDEGHSHESIDRHISAAYNTTPRTNPYPKPKTQADKSAYPTPKMQQYTPQAAKREVRPVETTVVNGRTYDRPAETSALSPAQQKAGKAFLVFIIIGLITSCMSSFLMLPVCIVLGMCVSGAAKKCEGDDTSKVDRAIVLSVIAVIAAFAILLAGHLTFDIIKDLLSNTGGTINE